MDTINLAARGLAHSVLELPEGSLTLLLLGPGEPESRVLDALLLELPAAAVFEIVRANGNGSIALVNGSRVVLERVRHEGRGWTPSLVVLTEDARRAIHDRRLDLSPLFALDAQLAYL